MGFLTYLDFYRIAKKLNEMNGNTYTEEEVAENAHCYTNSYNFSFPNFFASYILKNLCKEIDYDTKEEDLTVEEAEKILKNFLEDD